LPLERRGELGGGRGALVGRERAQRAPLAHRLDRQPRRPGRQPRAAGRRARGGRPGGGRYPRRGPRLPQGPCAGRAPGGGRAPSPGLEALPLMAETVGSARLAPLAPPSPRPIAAQRSTMLERFGVLARLLVHLLFRHVRVRAEAVEHLRQLARQGTLIYVMRYRSALDYLLVNAVLLREGLPLAIFRGNGCRRKESRLATLLYSVQEAPGEAKRFFNYLWNAEETQLTLGREIVLDRFVQDYRGEGDERIVRRLARALQIFLY